MSEAERARRHLPAVDAHELAQRATYRTKNPVRPSDAADRRYLEELIRAEGGAS